MSLIGLPPVNTNLSQLWQYQKAGCRPLTLIYHMYDNIKKRAAAR